MSAVAFGRVRSLWRGLTRLDRVALAILLLYGLVRASGQNVPRPGRGLLGFLFFISLGYFLIRLVPWVRSRLLWSIRNRLIVAYVFIAVVPVLLLVVMVGLSAYILYWQLGAYLLSADLQERVDKVGAVGDAVLAALGAEGARPASATLTSAAVSEMLSTARANLPGLEVELNTGEELLRTRGGPEAQRFAGLVQSGEKLWLRSVVVRRTPSALVVSVQVPVSAELLESLVPEMGPVQLSVTRPAGPTDLQGWIQIGDRRMVLLRAGQVSTRRRALSPRAHWFDYAVSGLTKAEAVSWEPGGTAMATNPVLVSFSARPSQLNRRLFRSLGEFGGAVVVALIAVGIVFLIIELAALITGIVLTRTITGTAADLYRATQHVQAGDLTYRVRVQRRDQLGVLGESFNSMTGSISALIEEQRQRQRLENELSIAREVQAHLFPRTLPSLPGIQLEAICRAARMVSGDYYDFIPLGPTRLGIAIADISGKGISAALLMASLQAALRSQVLLDGSTSDSTAEVVTRLNRHLFLNTSEDRYATLFYAVYDTATRTLRYTNAGHLPPLYLAGERVSKLEQGGMVVGLFDDCVYEQGSVQIEPGSLLVAYSDGLIEPENVYGEEFGHRRLLEVTLRHRQAPPRDLAEALVTAAEEWAGSPEQADDMTVIVARLE